MSVLLAHGSRVFLAGDAEKKAEEYMANGSYAGPLAIRPTGHFRGFGTIKQPDLRFRVLLTEGGSELKLARAQRKEARRGPPQPPTKVRLRCSYDRMPKKPDERALRYVKFCVLRQQGADEDWIAQKLGPGTPEALYKQLSQDGFPSCTAC